MASSAPFKAMVMKIRNSQQLPVQRTIATRCTGSITSHGDDPDHKFAVTVTK